MTVISFRAQQQISHVERTVGVLILKNIGYHTPDNIYYTPSHHTPLRCKTVNQNNEDKKLMKAISWFSPTTLTKEGVCV